jgi:hypothetical protein
LPHNTIHLAAESKDTGVRTSRNLTTYMAHTARAR